MQLCDAVVLFCCVVLSFCFNILSFCYSLLFLPKVQLCGSVVLLGYCFDILNCYAVLPFSFAILSFYNAILFCFFTIPSLATHPKRAKTEN